MSPDTVTNVVEFGTGIVAFVLALTVWLLTVAIAWLFYRPVLGIGLIMLAVALIVVLKMKLGKAKIAA